MVKQNLILIGGGGHCKSCIDVIEEGKQFIIKGIIDKPQKLYEKVFTYQVIGNDNDIENISKQYNHFFIAIGYVKISSLRKKLFSKIKLLDLICPKIISPNAYVSKHAFIDEGTIVMHQAVVNAGAKIGKNCIINTGSIIEHDVIIHDHCHVAPGVIINGETKIGEGAFIGSNSVCRQNITIGENCFIPFNSMVKTNILSTEQ